MLKLILIEKDELFRFFQNGVIRISSTSVFDFNQEADLQEKENFNLISNKFSCNLSYDSSNFCFLKFSETPVQLIRSLNNGQMFYMQDLLRIYPCTSSFLAYCNKSFKSPSAREYFFEENSIYVNLFEKLKIESVISNRLFSVYSMVKHSVRKQETVQLDVWFNKSQKVFSDYLNYYLLDRTKEVLTKFNSHSPLGELVSYETTHSFYSSKDHKSKNVEFIYRLRDFLKSDKDFGNLKEVDSAIKKYQKEIHQSSFEDLVSVFSFIKKTGVIRIIDNHYKEFFPETTSPTKIILFKLYVDFVVDIKADFHELVEFLYKEEDLSLGLGLLISLIKNNLASMSKHFYEVGDYRILQQNPIDLFDRLDANLDGKIDKKDPEKLYKNIKERDVVMGYAKSIEEQQLIQELGIGVIFTATVKKIKLKGKVVLQHLETKENIDNLTSLNQVQVQNVIAVKEGEKLQFEIIEQNEKGTWICKKILQEPLDPNFSASLEEDIRESNTKEWDLDKEKVEEDLFTNSKENKLDPQSVKPVSLKKGYSSNSPKISTGNKNEVSIQDFFNDLDKTNNKFKMLKNKKEKQECLESFFNNKDYKDYLLKNEEDKIVLILKNKLDDLNKAKKPKRKSSISISSLQSEKGYVKEAENASLSKEGRLSRDERQAMEDDLNAVMETMSTLDSEESKVDFLKQMEDLKNKYKLYIDTPEYSEMFSEFKKVYTSLTKSK